MITDCMKIPFDNSGYVRTHSGMREGTIDVRIKPEEREIIRAAADRQGLSMSAFIRMVSLKAAYTMTQSGKSNRDRAAGGRLAQGASSPG